MYHDARPTGSHENQDPYVSSAEILLMPQLLVSCDQQVERVLGRSEQRAVCQFGPSQFKDCLYNVAGQMVSEWYWSSLIEKDSHRDGRTVRGLDFSEALLGMLENSDGLLRSHAGKPL